jgi:hypothetical protein
MVQWMEINIYWKVSLYKFSLHCSNTDANTKHVTVSNTNTDTNTKHVTVSNTNTDTNTDTNTKHVTVSNTNTNTNTNTDTNTNTGTFITSRKSSFNRRLFDVGRRSGI